MRAFPDSHFEWRDFDSLLRNYGSCRSKSRGKATKQNVFILGAQ